MAACLLFVEASAYLRSLSVLHFLFPLPYNSSTYIRAFPSEMLSEDDPPNNLLYQLCEGGTFSILKNVLVVSHPINAWAAGRHALTPLQSSPEIVWMGMYRFRVTSTHVDFISQNPIVIVIEQTLQDVCIIREDDDPSVVARSMTWRTSLVSVSSCVENRCGIITTPELVTNSTVSPLTNPPASMMVLFCFS